MWTPNCQQVNVFSCWSFGDQVIGNWKKKKIEFPTKFKDLYVEKSLNVNKKIAHC